MTSTCRARVFGITALQISDDQQVDQNYLDRREEEREIVTDQHLLMFVDSFDTQAEGM